jgi:ferredoxin
VSSNYRFDLTPKTWEFIRSTRSGTAVFTMPTGPIKCAGAPQKIAYLAADHWRKEGVLGDIDVHLVVPTPRIFGIPEIADNLDKVIADYGITLHTQSELVAVDGDSRKIAIRDLSPGQRRSDRGLGAVRGAAELGGRHRLRSRARLRRAPRRSHQSAPDWVKASCIGCHACTVACKSEHDVPIGVNRTWVKYIETGKFPERRAVALTPGLLGDALQPLRRRTVHERSVRPRRTLFRADNGVVDFDDAVHRLQGVHERVPVRRDLHQPGDQHGAQVQLLQPPGRGRTRAVVRGGVPDPRHHRPVDLDDPPTRRSPDPPATRRRGAGAGAGHEPKVFYRGADQASLDPTRTAIAVTG